MTPISTLFLCRGRERNELSLWRSRPERHRLPQHHRGRHPSELRRNASGQELCITPVLEEYGYKRTAWVPAIPCMNSSGTGVPDMPTSSGQSAPAFPQISSTTAILLSKPSGCAGWLRQLYRKAVQAFWIIVRRGGLALATVRAGLHRQGAGAIAGYPQERHC